MQPAIEQDDNDDDVDEDEEDEDQPDGPAVGVRAGRKLANQSKLVAANFVDCVCANGCARGSGAFIRRPSPE
jgi:hypothetical protein